MISSLPENGHTQDGIVTQDCVVIHLNTQTSFYSMN